MRWSRWALICRARKIGHDCTEVPIGQPGSCRSQVPGAGPTAGIGPQSASLQIDEQVTQFVVNKKTGLLAILAFAIHA
jgi:hypothetical protein